MTAIATAYSASAADKRHDLILSHLPLVRHILGKMSAQFPPGVDVENLEAAGVCGLVEAASNFDPQRNATFRTYAYLRIRGAVLDELRRNCPLPQRVLESVTRVRRAYAELPAPVTVPDLVAATGLTADEVADCLAAVRLTRMISWGPESEPFATRLDDGSRPEDSLEREEMRGLLTSAIESLPEREKIVVTLYFRDDLRLKEISAVLHLSESRVSRILNTALFHLAERLRPVADPHG